MMVRAVVDCGLSRPRSRASSTRRRSPRPNAVSAGRTRPRRTAKPNASFRSAYTPMRLGKPTQPQPIGPRSSLFSSTSFDRFAKPSANGRYLREADFRDNSLFVRLGTSRTFRPKTFAIQIFLFYEYCAIMHLFQRSEAQHGTDSNTRAAAQRSGQGRTQKADFRAAARRLGL